MIQEATECIIANVKVIVGGAHILADVESAIETGATLSLQLDVDNPSTIRSTVFRPIGPTHDFRSMKVYIGEVIGTVTIQATLVIAGTEDDPEVLLVMADAPPP